MISKRVVGIVGMPGSGKSVADGVAKEMDFFVIIMGDIIREETAKRGLDPTPENIGKVMVEIRREEGSVVVAKRCNPKIQGLPNMNIIVEGIRNLAEVNEFHSQFPGFKLIAIHASPVTRFNRIFNRNRSDDAMNWQTFVNRDLREIEVGIGSAIALADYAIVNEDSSSCFKTNIRRCLKAIISE
ncbi:MAG: AAA family ATPase [Candidatus Bathyarchaeota archaeon]